ISDGFLQCDSPLRVGADVAAGTATMNITAMNRSSGALSMGGKVGVKSTSATQAQPGMATITGANSFWSVSNGQMTIGSGNQGTLIVSNGGRLESVGTLLVGNDAMGDGTLEFHGAAADSSQPDVTIGKNTGAGRLIIDGTPFSSGSLNVAKTV